MKIPKTQRAARAKRPTEAALLPKAQRTASNFCDECFDPFGSYTGVCKNKYEKPVQDADDL